MMQQAENLHISFSDPVDGNKGGAGNDKFHCPCQAARPAKVRMLLEKFNGFLDPTGHSSGCHGVLLGDIVTHCLQVGEGGRSPFKSSHVYPRC